MRSPFTDGLLRRAAALRARVVLAEGEDPRVREAALQLERNEVAEVTLLGGADTAVWAHRRASGVLVREPAQDPSLGLIADHLLERRPEKAGNSRSRARELAAGPLLFAAGLVATGEAEAAVAGAVHTTADVLRAALWAIGPAEGVATVSSSFYMDTAACGVLTFTDCGVVQYPSPEQLADIALSAARDRGRIVGDAPRVAFLSHATRGSADGDSIVRVRRALERFRALQPDVPADGELQVDAALVPEVAARKAPGSAVEGRANVLVFPDLDSGNIAYKLVQRIAGATALGPIVQGLARPCCDLSRGASAEDIVLVAAIALLQSAHS
jgi:phosphate acetyltransferase